MESNWGFLYPRFLLAETAVLLAALAVHWGTCLRGKRLTALLPAEGSAELRGMYRQRRWAYALFLLGMAAALLGASGPYWGQRTAAVETVGVSVIFVVDLSASMNAQDYRPSRLDAARLELSRLLERLKGQRIGIVGFAGTAQVLLPLTSDYTAAQMALDYISTGTIPVPGTALGDGVRVALERLGRAGGVLVLLSDGEDYHSEPLRAAQEAAKRGIPIVCVGIGTEKGSTVPSGEGGQETQLRDASGQVVTSRLDAAALQEIARITGGRYFRLQAGSDKNIEAVLSVVRDCRARGQMRREAKLLRDCGLYFLAAALIILSAALLLYARAGIKTAEGRRFDGMPR